MTAYPRHRINAVYKSAQQWPGAVSQFPTLPPSFGNNPWLPGSGSQWPLSFPPYNTNYGSKVMPGSAMQQLPSLSDNGGNSQQVPLRPRAPVPPFGNNGYNPQSSQQSQWPWRPALVREDDSQILQGLRSPPPLFPANINKNRESDHVGILLPYPSGNDGRNQDGIPDSEVHFVSEVAEERFQ